MIFDLWITCLRTDLYNCGKHQARLLRLIEIMNHTVDTQIQSQAVQCKICAGQSGTGTGFSLSTSFLPCHLEQWVRLGNLPVRQCSFGDLGVLDRKLLTCLINESVSYGILNW